MKNVLATTLLIGTLSLSLNTLAWDNMHSKPKHKKLDHIAQELELTTEQKEQFKAIHQQIDQTRKSGGGHKVMHELMALDPSASEYTEEVEKIATQKAENTRLRIMEMAQIRAQIHEILTPEQREKAKILHEEMTAQKQKKHWHH